MKSNFEVFVAGLGTIMRFFFLLMIVRAVSALVDIAAALQQIAASMP